MNFLKFVDDLPVKDKWVDELQLFITELKTDEREKANYMTYQMKIAEERNEARAEGRAEGEDKLSRLIAGLLEMGRNDEILSATKNPTLRNQLYEKYSIV